MNTDFTWSEKIELVAKALSMVQTEMPSVTMNKTNPFFNNSKYADLSAILVVANPILGKHDLALTQFLFSTDVSAGVTTLVLHASGQWMRQDVSLPLPENSKNISQAAGIIWTYLRRYSVAAILRIASEEDDDGNGATDNTQDRRQDKNKKEQSEEKKQTPEEKELEKITKENHDLVKERGGAANGEVKSAVDAFKDSKEEPLAKAKKLNEQLKNIKPLEKKEE